MMNRKESGPYARPTCISHTRLRNSQMVSTFASLRHEVQFRGEYLSSLFVALLLSCVYISVTSRLGHTSCPKLANGHVLRHSQPIILFDCQSDSGILPPHQSAVSLLGRAHGQCPSTSTDIDQLRRVRTTTSTPKTATLPSVGSRATVLTTSAATRSSSPSNRALANTCL